MHEKSLVTGLPLYPGPFVHEKSLVAGLPLYPGPFVHEKSLVTGLPSYPGPFLLSVHEKEPRCGASFVSPTY